MNKRGSININKLLSFIAIFIVVIVVFVTAAVFSKDNRIIRYRKAENIPQEDAMQQDTLTVLGEMRLRCKDCALVLSVWFSHDKDDTPFTEELEAKNRKIKAIIADFFSQYTQKELMTMKEINIKQTLLQLINEQLVLGKINNLYFNQYIFIS